MAKERGPVKGDIRPVKRATRRRRHVGCPHSHGAERYPSRRRRVDDGKFGGIHLVVLFGGQSAEHEVSCTTAAHVLTAADPAKSTRHPIGISTDGEWALAQGALDALEAGPQALPDRLDPSGPSLSPTPMLAERHRRPRAHRRPATAPRADGRGRHRAGDARARQRRLRRFRRARVGRHDGQGDGEAGAGRERGHSGPLPGVRRSRAHARPSRAARRGARDAVLREDHEHGIVGRRHEGSRRRAVACARWGPR